MLIIQNNGGSLSLYQLSVNSVDNSLQVSPLSRGEEDGLITLGDQNGNLYTLSVNGDDESLQLTPKLRS